MFAENGASVAVVGRDAQALARVAAAALFLASSVSSWITGVTLDVAGGKISL
jgi:NAD(P)-dependent dehydrogenase (short-subunit alcohol dehydrogenase family)